MYKHPFRIFIEVMFFITTFFMFEFLIMGLLVRAQPFLGLGWDAIFHVVLFFAFTVLINKYIPRSMIAFNIFMCIVSAFFYRPCI